MDHLLMQPYYENKSFHCPNCGVYASQQWQDVFPENRETSAGFMPFFAIENLKLCYCQHCKEPSVWYKESIIYPSKCTAPLPNPDIPKEIKTDYLEARDILDKSPRGAAAILRLVIQKLCIHFGEKGKKIDDDIKELVKKGLEPRIQKALDIVRVVGNNAVHPGQIDLADNSEIARKLFDLVNLIAHDMITRPKELDSLYQLLPEGARKAIEQRDQT